MSVIGALTWKWGQGCADGHLDTNGKLVIDRWVRQDIGQPTPAQIDQAVAEYAARDKAEEAAVSDIDADAAIKTLVFYLINHEHRLRALEGKPAISDAVAKAAIKDKYKSLLP